MSKQSKSKQVFVDEAVGDTSSTSDSDSNAEPIAEMHPERKQKKQTNSRIQKKAKVVNGVKYDILEEPSKPGPSKEDLKNLCKNGRDFIDELNLFLAKIEYIFLRH